MFAIHSFRRRRSSVMMDENLNRWCSRLLLIINNFVIQISEENVEFIIYALGKNLIKHRFRSGLVLFGVGAFEHDTKKNMKLNCLLMWRTFICLAHVEFSSGSFWRRGKISKGKRLLRSSGCFPLFFSLNDSKQAETSRLWKYTMSAKKSINHKHLLNRSLLLDGCKVSQWQLCNELWTLKTERRENSGEFHRQMFSIKSSRVFDFLLLFFQCRWSFVLRKIFWLLMLTNYFIV